MNILVNISHPAHVHFFKFMIRRLNENGHFVLVAARDKEMTLDLLRQYGIDHLILSRKQNGFKGMVKELLIQQLKLARLIKTHNIGIMLQIGGIFNAPVGRLFNIPTLAFYDTENAKLDNIISFFLSKHVLLTSCFDHRIGGSWKKQIHYPGYHELAYLTPEIIAPPPRWKKSPKRFFIRFVSWQAAHDLGERGLSLDKKLEIVALLSRFGQVHISSESPLPASISHLEYRLPPGDIHGFMAQCSLVVGESATMASEAACLGVPAVYISDTGRGYTTEQDQVYGLVRHFRICQWDEIRTTIRAWASKDLFDQWQTKRQRMLADKIDVSQWLTDLVLGYPASIEKARKQQFSPYTLSPLYREGKGSCAG